LRRIKRNRGTFISHKRKLSSDARLIVALLNKQPQKMNELCKRAGMHSTTFYRLRPLLESKGIIKETKDGYALWTYSEIEETVVETVNKWKSLAFRYPTIQEIADETSIVSEEVMILAYKTKDKTGWSLPNEGIIASAREKLGEILVCAARIRDGTISNFDYEKYPDDPEILGEAERFLKKHPQMLPKLNEEEAGDVSWPEEALKYLGKGYEPKDRHKPQLFFVPRG